MVIEDNAKVLGPLRKAHTISQSPEEEIDVNGVVEMERLPKKWKGRQLQTGFDSASPISLHTVL